MRFRVVLPALCVFAIAASLGAQKRFTLTIENIMRGPGLTGYEPSAPRFSGDSQRMYFEWKQASDPVLQPVDTYQVNRDGSALEKLSDEEAKLAPPATGDRARDHARTVYTGDDDIFLYDHRSGRTRRISTRTVDAESNPHFTRDGKRVWFTRSNNLYLLSLDDGSIEELTDIRAVGAASDSPAPGATGQGQRGARAASAPPTTDPPKGTDSQEFVKKKSASCSTW